MSTNYSVSLQVKSKFNRSTHVICNDYTKYVANPATDFTRNRKLSFEDTFSSLLHMEKGSTFKEIQRLFHAKNAPTTTAFYNRQAKIISDAYKELFNNFTNSFSGKMKKHLGYRVIAVDGSVVMTPLNKNEKALYRNNGTCSIHLNAAYDVVNNIFTDVEIVGTREANERAAFLEMLQRCPYKQNCIWLADCGYESANVFAHIIEAGSKFVFRVKDINSNSTLKNFHLPDEEFDKKLLKVLTDGKAAVKGMSFPEDAVIVHTYNKRRLDFFTKEKPYYELNLRVVRFKTEKGKYVSLVTNLTEKEASTEDIIRLYAMRWGVETAFKHLKYTACLNCFHSSKQAMIEKEMYAKIIVYNFAGLIACQLKVKKPKNSRLEYKINMAAAINICKTHIDTYGSHDVDSEISSQLTPIRKNRHFPRGEHEHKAVPFQNR